MDILVKDKIYLTNPPAGMAEWVAQMATFENPEFTSRVKRGSWTGNLSQWIYLYSTNQMNGVTVMECPRGLLRPLYDAFKNSMPLNIVDQRILPAIEPFNMKEDKTLRNYQEEAISIALKRAQGIIVSPAGSGKTVMGIGIAQQTKTKVLWFTHKKELIYQAKERFLEYSDIAEDRIGIYGDGTKEIKDVTIATVQTLANLNGVELQNFAAEFGCIIVDEAHHTAADTWRMIDKFPAKYRIGITATNYRSDSLTEMPKAVLGREIYSVDRNLLLSDECILKAKLYFIETHCKYDADINDNALLNRLISTDAYRNDLIVKMVDISCQTHNCMVILTNLVYHTEHLAELIRSRLDASNLTRPVFVFHAHSKFSVDDLKDLEQYVVVATFGKAEEGLDIPQLDSLLFAAPVRAERRLEQSIGRIERPLIGKKQPRVYDIYDNDEGVLMSKCMARKRFYDKRGMEQVDIPMEYLESI